MKITIEFTAVLDVKHVASGSTVELAQGATVKDLLHLLKVKENHQRYVVPFVNGEQKKLTAKLQDGDKVFLSLPVGGG